MSTLNSLDLSHRTDISYSYDLTKASRSIAAERRPTSDTMVNRLILREARVSERTSKHLLEHHCLEQILFQLKPHSTLCQVLFTHHLLVVAGGRMKLFSRGDGNVLILLHI